MPIIEIIHCTGPEGTTLGYEILQTFPFTSETKRMGIILRRFFSPITITSFIKYILWELKQMKASGTLVCVAIDRSDKNEYLQD